jgi:glutathione S-transferase
MKHHQINFVEKRVPLFTKTTNAELSEYNSDFKVPVLKDDELVVWDSLSILEYLSEHYLHNTGWPSNVKARSIARSISSEMHSSFPNVRNELPMNCRTRYSDIRLSDEAKREIDRISWLWERCQTEYGDERGWLFGEFSIADAMFAPIAIRFYGYSISLDDIQEKYVKTVLAHPGIIEWIEAGKLESEVISASEI